jgi:hypothetical protein
MERGIFEQEWLCSTVREKPVYCDHADGKNVSEPDAALSERVAIEGIDLYGLKMAYYSVSEHAYQNGASTVDPLFGEQQLETIDRAFWFMGYVTQLPPNVRTYQLQGIWGEDIVQVYVAISSFQYFSTYGGSDRNTPGLHDELNPRIGDIVYLPNNGTLYEIVDVKYWEEAFGLTPRYNLITLRVYKDTKRTVSNDPSIPQDDPIRKASPSEVSAYQPTTDVLKIDPEETTDEGRIDLFDWTYDFNEENR